MDSQVRILGTEDATTCHAIILRHPITGVTALAHADTCAHVGRQINAIVEDIWDTSEWLFATSAAASEARTSTSKPPTWDRSHNARSSVCSKDSGIRYALHA